VIKVIKLLVIVELVIYSTYYIFSKEFYANLQVASVSSFLIMLGSFYAYKKMIKAKVLTENYEIDRDELDVIDDPYGLYDDITINETPSEELDLREIVKEEKAKIKTFSFGTIKKGVSAGVSVFRIVPYIFLILGFIALKNNDLLDISIYLPSLLIGMVIAYISSKELFT